MSDQQKAITAITVLIETCKIAKQSSIVDQPELEDSPPLEVLHKDLISLLSLIYGAVTKLSLALKPSSPTYSACLAQIKDLSDRVLALSHLINLFNRSLHGATLTRELKTVVIDVIGAVQALATTFLENEGSGQRSSSNDYLVRTGEVHSIIETARSSNGLSKDNLAAVRRHWLKDAGLLEDGAKEVGEMIENAESENDPAEEEDGWDELGIEPSKPLTEEEFTRTKKVLIVLRLCNVLHRKVVSDILSTSFSSLSISVQDNLAAVSPVLLSTSDELISTLDSPQDSDSVTTELNALKKIIDDIRDRLSPILKNEWDPGSLEGSLERISLSEIAPVSTNRNQKAKWFESCFDQIAKAIQSAALVGST